MKIKIVQSTQNELKLEIEGMGHTFCNLLQKRLLDHEKVDLAGYDIPHPLDSTPILYVRAKGDASPGELLQKAGKKTRNLNKDFKRKLKETLKA